MCCNEEVCKKFHKIITIYDKWDDHIVKLDEHPDYRKDMEEICYLWDEINCHKFILFNQFRGEEYRDLWHFLLRRHHEWLITQVK